MVVEEIRHKLQQRILCNLCNRFLPSGLRGGTVEGKAHLPGVLLGDRRDIAVALGGRLLSVEPLCLRTNSSQLVPLDISSIAEFSHLRGIGRGGAPPPRMGCCGLGAGSVCARRRPRSRGGCCRRRNDERFARQVPEGTDTTASPNLPL